MTEHGQHSVLLQLWVPVTIFAHLFAAVWLVRAFQLFQPALWARIVAKLCIGRRAHEQLCQQGTAGGGAVPSAANNQPWTNGDAVNPARQPNPDSQSAAAADNGAANTATRDMFACYTSMHSRVLKQTRSTCSEGRSNSSSSSSNSSSSSSSNSNSNVIGHAVTVIDTPPCCQARYIQYEHPAEHGNDFNNTRVKQQLQESKNTFEQQAPYLQLSWQGVGCSYKTASGSKAVLQDVWGQADAGEMQALLGPSGSGKSHLLDILAHRKTTGSIAGDILINGQKVPSSSYRRMIAYVPQDDNFIPALTASECLMFYAAMLLPDHQQIPAVDALLHNNTPEATLQATPHSRQQRMQQGSRAAVVERVLRLVGLGTHGSTMVGGRLPGGLLLRGLSSGERRRLSIAVGILANPSLLFLDEPTSGLDSFAALSVMKHLQDVAHSSGRAVITAIHQPRSAIWCLFDKVTLLASGLLVYHGPTSGLVPWLSHGLGYCYEPAVHGLVSDWALDLVVVDFNKSQALPGHTMTSVAELQAAATAFKQQCAHRTQSVPQQQVDCQQDRHLVACVPAMNRATAKQPSDASRYSVGTICPAEGQPLSKNLPQGPFSRGGSFPGTSSAVLHSGSTSQDDGDVNDADSRCGSSNYAVTISSSDCSSNSSQQPMEQPQPPPQGSSSISSRLVAASAQVLQTLMTTPGGIHHSSSSDVEANDTPAAVIYNGQHHTSACDAVLVRDTLHMPASHKHGSAPALAVQLQVMRPHTPATNLHTGSATGSRHNRRKRQSNYLSGWWRQYQALARRELLKVTRNPADVAGRTLTFTWVALLVGLIYYDLPLDASSIRQRLNLLFATLCFFLLMPFISMSMYTDDKGVYLADRAARLYRPVAYYLAKTTVVLPFNILSSLCYSLIQYGMTGMRPGAINVLKHGTVGTLTSLIAVLVLHLAATVTPNQDAAFMMGIGWTCTNLVMSGFFIPYREIHFSALSNLRYLSALHYAFEGLLAVEFSERTFPCPAAGLDSVSADFFTGLLPGAASLVTPAMLQKLTDGSETTAGCVVNSAAVARYFGFSRSFEVTVGVLIAYLGVLHLFTYAAMFLVARREGR